MVLEGLVFFWRFFSLFFCEFFLAPLVNGFFCKYFFLQFFCFCRNFFFLLRASFARIFFFFVFANFLREIFFFGKRKLNLYLQTPKQTPKREEGEMEGCEETWAQKKKVEKP